MLLDVADRLLSWCPADWTVAADWQPIVQPFLASEAGQELGNFIQTRLADGATIYPPEPFRALALTPLRQVRVLIVGQDPYHGPGQAEGLAFSVAPGIRLPPSLRNIFKELAREVDAVRAGKTHAHALSTNGSLVHWAQQGVLLLNSCLTVEAGLPASHANRGWEVLTDAIIRAFQEAENPLVFMLWGAHAQKLERLVSRSKHHLVLTANHPSPLSALRPPQPFIGCNHFALANDFLAKHGQPLISWHNPGFT